MGRTKGFARAPLPPIKGKPISFEGIQDLAWLIQETLPKFQVLS